MFGGRPAAGRSARQLGLCRGGPPARGSSRLAREEEGREEETEHEGDEAMGASIRRKHYGRKAKSHGARTQ
jgi:hypothetical protein